MALKQSLEESIARLEQEPDSQATKLAAALQRTASLYRERQFGPVTRADVLDRAAGRSGPAAGVPGAPAGPERPVIFKRGGFLEDSGNLRDGGFEPSGSGYTRRVGKPADRGRFRAAGVDLEGEAYQVPGSTTVYIAEGDAARQAYSRALEEGRSIFPV